MNLKFSLLSIAFFTSVAVADITVATKLTINDGQPFEASSVVLCGTENVLKAGDFDIVFTMLAEHEEGADVALTVVDKDGKQLVDGQLAMLWGKPSMIKVGETRGDNSEAYIVVECVPSKMVTDEVVAE